MGDINPNKPFRVIVRSRGHYKTVANRAASWGFRWRVEVKDRKVPYAVIFYPNVNGERIIHRQISKHIPNTTLLAYCSVKSYSFDYFMNSRLRYKTRKSSDHYEAYPVRAISRSNDVLEFDSASDAIDFLHSQGHPKAKRHAIYQCIQPYNNRNTAYGYRWERVDQKIDEEE
ncbi:MAG: hypothetical protein ACWA44_02325 [Thiotrichales bacterium]